MARACIHYSCCFCGPSIVCLTAPMAGEYFTCSSNHRYFVTAEERDKINLAFKEMFQTSTDVYLS